MSDSALDIESVVREVIRRLTNGGNGRDTGVGADEGQNTDAGTMRLTEQVVSLAQLEGRLDCVSRLVVPSHAVVTPAVSDELRKNGITLQRDCERTEAIGEIDSRWRILVGGHETGFDWRALSAAKPSNRYDFELIEPVKLELLLDEIETRLHAPCTLGLIVSSAPHVVACQANRNSAFRAAVVCDAREAAEARQTLDANLLAVGDTSVYRLLQIVSSAVRTKGGKVERCVTRVH